MTNLFIQLEHKEPFLIMMAQRLGLSRNYLRNIIYEDRVPEKHKAFIENAIKQQLLLDEKIRNLQKKHNENI